jgi:hypothetical protein
MLGHHDKNKEKKKTGYSLFRLHDRTCVAARRRPVMTIGFQP